MNRWVKFLIVLSLILFCFTSVGRSVMKQDAPPAVAAQLLKKIASYEEGQSREDLIALADIVRGSHGSPNIREQLQIQLLKFLRSDATADSKNFICRQLSIIGTEEAVPTLVEMLNQPEVSQMSLYALQSIQGQAVDKALCNALDKTVGETKIGIINSLGQRGSSTAVVPLGKLLSDTDDEIAQSAAAALGKIADTAAAEQLGKALKQTSGNRRAVLADAYLNCAYNLASSGDKQAAAEIYKRLYDSAEPVHIRSAALTGIVDAAPQEALEFVTGAVKSSEPALQSAAIRLVKRLPEADFVAEEMPNLSSDAQVQLITALADSGSNDLAVLHAVIDAVKSENQSVRIAALKALTSLGDASTVTLLAQTAADANGLERQAARESLYSLNAPGVNEKIIERIPHANPQFEVELIKSLGERNVTEALPSLLETVHDPDIDVRIESIKVLKNFAEPKHLKALVDAMTNAKSAEELKEAERTVSAVARKAEGSAPAKIVQDAFISAEHTEVCCALLRVLGNIGDRRSLGGLRVALRDENEKIHAEAVRTLSNWPDAAPADDLLKIAITPHNETCRVLALRGYVRMAALDDGRAAKEKLNMFKHAMAVASSPGDRKMILSALAKVPSPGTLQMAVDCLDKEDTKQEAVVAVVKIAKTTVEDEPEKTKFALEKALASTDSDTKREQIQQLLDGIK